MENNDLIEINSNSHQGTFPFSKRSDHGKQYKHQLVLRITKFNIRVTKCLLFKISNSIWYFLTVFVISPMSDLIKGACNLGKTNTWCPWQQLAAPGRYLGKAVDTTWKTDLKMFSLKRWMEKLVKSLWNFDFSSILQLFT